MRNTFRFSAGKVPQLKDRLLNLAATVTHSQFLDSNAHHDKYSRYEWIAAIGAFKTLETHSQNSFEALNNFHSQNNDWLFGHLNYDLKNELEDLESNNPDKLKFHPIFFFIPQTVIYCRENTVTVESHIYKGINDFLEALPAPITPVSNTFLHLRENTGKKQYLETIAALKDELQYGNIYEINYCIEFATHQKIEPIHVFKRLNQLSKAPFAAFYKCQDQYLACASPERYLQKTDNKIISQPIKGTAPRSTNTEEDENLKVELLRSEKERAENVMIVDLVRNDLSRTAAKASVKVDELFGIYSYPGVHQMVSTISSEVHSSNTFADVIKYSFPMGSMTGAPKISAMKLIEKHENFSRSLYSGSVGYITPSGDFDFNVVIRSIFYNEINHYISARVGSAITVHCDAAMEYEECLLKAQNLFRVFTS